MGSVRVEPTAGLQTSENGDTAVFSVRLDVAPAADVIIPLSSSDESEGTVSPSELTFTPDNWAAAQTVTVTGVDDDELDGPQSFRIDVEPARSNDRLFDDFDAPDVDVINQDDETPSVAVVPTEGLTTGELGRTATFSVVLTAPPTADVSIDLQSSDPSEGVIDQERLVFTPTNFASPQSVTITGVDDEDPDGSIDYTIELAPTRSQDPRFEGIDPPDVMVVNIDDETAGILVLLDGSLRTDETGRQASFSVVLNNQPQAAVRIPLESSDPGEGSIRVEELTFTPDNWRSPQQVTVSGVDDDLVDGDQVYNIDLRPAISGDSRYEGVDAEDVELTNIDDDTPGVSILGEILDVSESGTTSTFSVVLNTQPSADVRIPLASSDESEAIVSPAELIFTSENWAGEQTVTVTGVDDEVADGTQPVRVDLLPIESADEGYDELDPENVELNVADDDSPGVTIDPETVLSVSESGTSAVFTLVLNSRPTADVVIGLSSADPSEVIVSPESIRFTPDNWSGLVSVTVTGVDDDAADGTPRVDVIVASPESEDAGYAALSPRRIAVENVDNDSPGYTIDIDDGVEVSESGTSDTFTVALNSRPSADVTLELSSTLVSEATVDPERITFTPDNWNSPATVRVTGQDDDTADGNRRLRVEFADAVSDDAGYAGTSPEAVSVLNLDNDEEGVTVRAESELEISEAGGRATFTVVLTTRPTADVRIPLRASDPTEASLEIDELIFTPTNWAGEQTVTVIGVDDDVADGTQPVRIEILESVSDDAGYNGIDPRDVELSNTDNDSAGIQIETDGDLEVSESGTTAVFTVVLNSQPTADVEVALSSGDSSEVTVSPESIRFTPDNWSGLVEVTLTGVDDDVADGTPRVEITIDSPVSDDSAYAELPAQRVDVLNVDNDSPGYMLELGDGVEVSETGTVDSFTLILNSRPTADVTLSVQSSDTAEATVSPAELTFTPDDWDSPHVVRVTGVNDEVADGDRRISIQFGVATSTDTGYAGTRPESIEVVNVDDDEPGIAIDAGADLRTTESGGAVSFTVALSSAPTHEVTVTLSVSDEGEAVLDDNELTFTPSDWDAQTVTLTGVDDEVSDGDQAVDVTVGPSTSEDPNYGSIPSQTFTIRNEDDDDADLVVTPSAGVVVAEDGAEATLSVVLGSMPTAVVSVSVGVSDAFEIATNVTSFTIDPDDWESGEAILVSAVDDSLADGTQAERVTLTTSSDDPDYEGLTSVVEVTSQDNEEPAPRLVINEVDYDQRGSDTAEFVEIYNGGTADAELATISLELVNGASGAVYQSIDLSGTLAPGEFLVVGTDGLVLDDDVLFIALPDGANIQNGDPDAVALFDNTSETVIDALSYEGEVTEATIGGAGGTFNLVEGNATGAEDTGDGALIRYPDGRDTGDAARDWALADPTPGALNAAP